jgi:hypothetical protein
MARAAVARAALVVGAASEAIAAADGAPLPGAHQARTAVGGGGAVVARGRASGWSQAAGGAYADQAAAAIARSGASAAIGAAGPARVCRARGPVGRRGIDRWRAAVRVVAGVRRRVGARELGVCWAGTVQNGSSIEARARVARCSSIITHDRRAHRAAASILSASKRRHQEDCQTDVLPTHEAALHLRAGLENDRRRTPARRRDFDADRSTARRASHACAASH